MSNIHRITIILCFSMEYLVYAVQFGSAKWAQKLILGHLINGDRNVHSNRNKFFRIIEKEISELSGHRPNFPKERALSFVPRRVERLR